MEKNIIRVLGPWLGSFFSKVFKTGLSSGQLRSVSGRRRRILSVDNTPRPEAPPSVHIIGLVGFWILRVAVVTGRLDGNQQ